MRTGTAGVLASRRVLALVERFSHHLQALLLCQFDEGIFTPPPEEGFCAVGVQRSHSRDVWIDILDFPDDAAGSLTPSDGFSETARGQEALVSLVVRPLGRVDP